MKKIILSQGKKTIVDDKDFEWLNQWKWYTFDNGSGFIAVRNKKNGLKRTTEYMARLILDCPKDLEVDHINHDTLDNRRQNIRIVSHQNNCKNRRKRSDNRSGFKGVSWEEDKQCFRASIFFEKKQRFIGFFENKRHAALAYDLWAKELHGEFAKLNF